MPTSATAAPLQAARGTRRSRERAKGVGATVLLALIAVGVPIGLLVVFGNPVPTLPGGGLSSAVVSPDFLLDVIACVVWLAWAQFAACLLAELVAGVRGSGLPRRVPLAGVQQDLARRLVMGVLLLSTAGHGLQSAARPVTAAGAPVAATVHTASAGGIHHVRDGHHAAEPGSARPSRPEKVNAPSHPGGPTARTGASAAPARHEVAEYVVMPPHGRHYDSLWDIASRYLGDGRRYKEIFALNAGRMQPDGAELTLASLIRPGWVLVLPADAHGPGLVEASVEGAPSVPAGDAAGVPAGDAARVPAIGASSVPGDDAAAVTAGGAVGVSVTASAGGDAAPATHDGQHPAGQDDAGQAGAGRQAGVGPGGKQQPATGAGSDTQAGAPLGPLHGTGSLAHAGATAETGANAGAPVDHGAGPHRSGTGLGQAPPQRDPGIPWDLVGAELLAAGVIETLIAMRRRRARGRPAGAAVALPDADGAAAEVAVRLGADPRSAQFLDRALRALARLVGEHDRPVPEVYAARLGEDRLELMLAVPQHRAPAPFTASEDGATWALRRDAALPEVDGVPAPLPGLVSIGGDGSGRVFVDLEAAGGVVSVRGQGTNLDAARSVAAAAAVELVTNRWSDDMRVTLVGFGSALAPLRPDRLRCVATLREVLDDVTDRASDAAQALTGAGLESVLTGRIRSAATAGIYAPEFLVLAGPPDPAELAELQSWLAGPRRTPLGVLVAGDVESARWRLEIAEDGSLSTGVLGMRVGAQQLSARSYAGLARLLAAEDAADRAAASAAAAAAEAERAAPTGLAAAPLPVSARPGVPAPRLPRRVVPDPAITIRIMGEPGVDGADLRPGTPLAVEVVAYLALVGEISPRELSAAVWPYGVTQAERDAAIARTAEWLRDAPDGKPRLRQSDSGRLLLTDDVQLDWHLFVAATDGADEHSTLNALELVRGPLAARHLPRRYAWFAKHPISAMLPAYVADVAHNLARGYLQRSEFDGAAAAARAGLRVEPQAGLLWSDLTAAVTGRDGASAATAIDAERRAAYGEAAGWEHVGERLSA